jgi:hypothetical protein
VFALRRGLREWPWQMSPTEILAAIAAIFVAFVVVAWLWRTRWRHGPAEAVLRVGDVFVRNTRSRSDDGVWVERLSDPTRPHG